MPQVRKGKVCESVLLLAKICNFTPLSNFQLKAVVQLKETHESESVLLSAKSCSLQPFPIQQTHDKLG